MLVSLYTVRVVLSVLGAEDFGIYNVVAGVVLMFSFLSGAMATASQRFLSFEMGRGNEQELENIFSVTLAIYLFLSVLLIIVAETLGLWFINTKLVIPPERLTAAKWVYQCAIISFLITIMTTPYMSAIIAHENMNVYAYVSIVEAVLKLAVVLFLRIGKTDKLILYGILLLGVAIINTALYRSYCKRHYKECKFRISWNSDKFKEIISYIGFDLFGNFSVLIRTQGVNLLLNVFFTAIINAATAIATSIQNTVMSFANNLLSAFRPQIVKSYASNDYKEMIKLIRISAVFTTYLLLLFSLPLSLEIDFVLKMWLKEVPFHTSMICQYLLIFNVIANLSSVIMTGIHATGRIKRSSFINGSLYILVIPVSCVGYKMGLSVEFAFIFNICMVCCGLFQNMCALHNYVMDFWKSTFFARAIFPNIVIATIVYMCGLFFQKHFEPSLFRLFFTVIFTTLFLSLLTYCFVFTQNERILLRNKLNNAIKDKIL